MALLWEAANRALHREMNRMFDDFLRDFDVSGRIPVR